MPRRGPGERRAGRQTLRRRRRRRLTGARGRRAEEQPASGGGAGATTRWPGWGGSARTARAQSAPAGDGPAGTRKRHEEENAGSATSWRRRHGGGRGNLLKRRSGSRPLLPAAMGGSTGRESRVGPWVCASAWSVRTSGQGARLRSGDANVSLYSSADFGGGGERGRSPRQASERRSPRLPEGL